jgi:hypothetical protein
MGAAAACIIAPRDSFQGCRATIMDGNGREAGQ